MSSSSYALTRLRYVFSKPPKPISTIQPIPTSPNPFPSQVQQLVTRFKNKSYSPQFRGNRNSYEAAVRRLSAGKHYSAIENIIEYQKNFKHHMSNEGFGARLIKLYGKVGMFDHAYKVFDELPQFDCRRTVMSFNALLSACVKTKNLGKVGELFVELPPKLGIRPDVISYNTVIKAFCESNDVDSAMKVVEKMERSEIRPNVVSYNTVLEGYYRRNNMAEAERLWRRMEEMGVIFDVWSYNSKLRSLIKNGEIQEALELVEKMVTEGVRPNSHIYNELIKGYVDNLNWEGAKMWHGKMAGDGCLPDHVTYGVLIPCACDMLDIDFALELCKQAVALRVPVYKSVMQLVVDALINVSKIEEANELIAMVNSSRKHHYTLKFPVTG